MPSMDEAMPSLTEPLEVIDTGVTESDDGTRYPTVVIDATGRPDVTDLARVHAVEGIGDVATYLELTDDSLLLTVRLTRPVIAEFVVRFELPGGLPVLADAAVAGHLLLATTVPDMSTDLDAHLGAELEAHLGADLGADVGAAGTAAPRHPAWLAVDIDGARLAEVLLPIAREQLGTDGS